jgi:hypothetical protein
VPLLLWQLLLLLQLLWGVGVCISVRRRCRRHCHGVNFAVIVAASAAIATAVGGGRTIINFAGAFFKSKVMPEYIKDQRQQNSAGARQKICMVMVPSLSNTKNSCRSPGYFFAVCRKILIPTWKEPF